jgi:hypothetical protein
MRGVKVVRARLKLFMRGVKAVRARLKLFMRGVRVVRARLELFMRGEKLSTRGFKGSVEIFVFEPYEAQWAKEGVWHRGKQSRRSFWTSC